MFNIQSAVQTSMPITEGRGAAAFTAAGPGPATRKTTAAPDRQNHSKPKWAAVEILSCGAKMLPREAA